MRSCGGLTQLAMEELADMVREMEQTLKKMEASGDMTAVPDAAITPATGTFRGGKSPIDILCVWKVCSGLVFTKHGGDVIAVYTCIGPL